MSQKIYTLTPEATLEQFQTDQSQGQSPSDIARLQAEHGKNVLPRGESISPWRILLNQFTDLMVIILIAASVISLLIGETRDFLVIMAIIILNAVIGFYQEYRAEQAVQALSALQVVKTRVRRGGAVQEIDAEDLVPGDIVLLEEGDSVPADGRILISNSLLIEEAALTGESNAISKSVDALQDENIAIGDRTNMVFMGTVITYGRGEILVTHTGSNTELGHIANLLSNVEESQTPLQRRLNQVSRVLAIGAIIVVALVMLVGVIRGNPLQQMFLTAISLAVAAVPEGMPALVTISLSLGASRMVQRNALIRRLPAVETLGSVTVICSDKTGTLTRNEMTATNIAMPDYPDVEITGIGYSAEGEFFTQETGERIDTSQAPGLARVLQAIALSTNAHVQGRDGDKIFDIVGDTTEGALLIAAKKIGRSRETLEIEMPRRSELPFSSERKAMTTVHQIEAKDAREVFPDTPYVSITKGAPDRLIDWALYEQVETGVTQLSPERRKRWQDYVDMMASQGLRVLGVAYRNLDAIPDEIDETIERELILLALIGISDPARPEAKAAISTAKKAGIRTIMITGDHALTAEAISRELGILNEGERAITGVELSEMSREQLLESLQHTSTFARVSPEHKLRIVEALQSQGEIAAMTGDGVNDAPALKQADIGVAMGITGTDVSKNVAEMILTDDNFASIVAAVEEGRVVYDNIRKFLRYLLSSNVAEILVMFFALIAGFKLPLLAIQILWVNLVTDGLPAIALGFEDAEVGVMDREPRNANESIFAGGTGRYILFVGSIITILTVAGFVWAHSNHGLIATSPTLGLELLDSNQLGDLIGEEYVPDNWETLDESARIEMMDVGAEGDHHEEGSDGLVDRAERIPRTIAFSILALSQIFSVMAIHVGDRVPFLSVGFKSNRLLLWACLVTFALQLIVIYTPFGNALLDTSPLSGVELLVVFLASATVFIIVELDKWIRNRNDGNLQTQPAS